MTDTKNLQAYGTFDLGALEKQDAQISATSGGGADFMKLVPGKNTVRFLPPAAGAGSLEAFITPFIVVNEHFIEGADKRRIRFACPRLMEKKSCPACAEFQRLQQTHNPIDREKSWNFKPSLRIYVNVIDRSQPDSGPRILAFGKTIWDGLKRIRTDQDEGGDFTDCSDEGFDIVIHREGTGKTDTKYTVRPARNDSGLGVDISVLENQWDLQNYTKVPTLDEVISWMSGEEPVAEAPREMRTISEPRQPKLSPRKNGRKRSLKTKKASDAIYELDADGDSDDIKY